jgi:hypothetical protein
MADKKIIKKIIGPVAVTPELRKQESVDGDVKTSEKGGGVRVDTKYGYITLDKDKVKYSSSNQPDFKTDTKRIGVGKDFDIKGGKLSIDLNKGKTKSSTDKSKTKGGKITYTKSFKKGGLVKSGKPKLAKRGWK